MVERKARALDAALVEKQANNNRQTAQNWELYAGHRGNVTRLIGAGGSSARLCVLGAGNCNSFDLEALAQRFAEVHLCDVDPAALQAGLLQSQRRF